MKTLSDKILKCENLSGVNTGFLVHGSIPGTARVKNLRQGIGMVKLIWLSFIERQLQFHLRY